MNDDLIREAPRSWLVRWRDVSHDESLAWFQASRRPSGAPLEGEEIVSAEAYDSLADALERAEKERDEARERGGAGVSGPYPGPWYHADYYFAQKERAEMAEAERDRLLAENERLVAVIAEGPGVLWKHAVAAVR